MSWYRTYRPQTVSQLHIAQVRETLSKMLASGNIPHALLFAGPKGTGKTSSARIIAKVLNCEKNSERKDGAAFAEPCNACAMCLEITEGSALNVLEMDGASNRRIDDIRDLKERIYMPPAMGLKSVYIIDEVHMLTKEAFNALLKMLEEPPEHAVFIFATTDPQKIPDTILSRSTRVQFTRASVAELANALAEIGKKESVEVEKESLELIAQNADGSFRDAVKLFEQLANQAKADKKKITADWVQEGLSTISQDSIKKLLQSILAKDEKAIVEFFQTARNQQIDAVVIHKQLLNFLHTELIKGVMGGEEPFAKKEIVMFLIKQFSGVEIPLLHPFPHLPLELCAIEMVLRSKEKSGGSGGGTIVKKVEQTKRVEVTVVERPQSTQVTQSMIPEFEPELELAPEIESIIDVVESITPVTRVSSASADIINADSLGDGAELGQRWNDLLSNIAKHNLSLGSILRSAQFVNGEQGRATVKVFYGFHKEQLELQRYRAIVDQAIVEMLGGMVRLEYILSAPNVPAATQVDNVSGEVDKEFVNVIEEALL